MAFKVLKYSLEFLHFAFKHAEFRGLKHPRILPGRLLQNFRCDLTPVLLQQTFRQSRIEICEAVILKFSHTV